MGKYRHLNYNDRKKIEKLSKEGLSMRKVARELGFHPATIYREIKRGGGIGNYNANIAQKNS